MIALVILPAVFLLTYFGVSLFRHWSLTKGFMDVPNERSSHDTPTPRGGGAVITSVCLIFYFIVSIFYPGAFSWGYFLGGALIAIVSWLDDVYSIWSVWRFIAHSTAAVILIADLGYWHEVYLPLTSFRPELGIFGAVITFLWIVWLINAYNFMDGIDGLAGLQAVIAGFGWLVLGYLLEMPSLLLFSGIIASASLGFLIHNWNPANIFMGDVGSAFLGYTFAALPLLAGTEAVKMRDLLPVVAVLFVWFFLFDSVVTLVRRGISGRKVWNAHREHLYQKLVSSGLSHRRVTLIYGILASILNFSFLLSIRFSENVGLAVVSAVFILTFILLFICFSRRALN